MLAVQPIHSTTQSYSHPVYPTTPAYLVLLQKNYAETRSAFYVLQKSVNILDSNFESRYKYGNRQKTGLKIMHWNPGGKYLKNKIENIESVINGYKPDLLGISESNHFRAHDIQDVQIENYRLYLSNTINNDNLKVSRIAVYVHKDMHAQLEMI